MKVKDMKINLHSLQCHEILGQQNVRVCSIYFVMHLYFKDRRQK